LGKQVDDYLLAPETWKCRMTMRKTPRWSRVVCREVSRRGRIPRVLGHAGFFCYLFCCRDSPVW